MRVLSPKKTPQPINIDPYDDPVEYLRELGIEAELVAVLETPVQRAA